MGLGLIVALLVSLVIAVVLYKLLKAIWPLVYNGLFGLGAFWGLNYFGIITIPIDVWTLGIAAIGGPLGVLVVLILTYLKIPL